MYIPIWVAVIAVIIYYLWYKSQQENQRANTPEHFELFAENLKNSLLQFEHFDSPRIIDLQDQYEVMETNYLRLKQRSLSNEERRLELAKDWARYTEALYDLKSARVLLDVDFSDSAYDNFAERSKEPYIISDEVEKKFKSLLGKDFQKLPPDYDERRKKAGKKDTDIFDDWKQLYGDSPNYFRMVEYRAKEKKQKA